MVRGMFKSRTLRRVFKKTPGGDTVLHHEKRKPAHAKCGECGAVLKGVPREIPNKLNKLSKSEKKPERPYGGNLCSACTKQKIKLQARQQE
ncbi:50S ribosomal protein L34e [Candidatus Woesearchaeota archaeon]|nr:MAG: 50S ribosomal protein L34e [Candidatus Woesearchaeota archaeon]